ncbi:MAG TPA: lysylphosphatidylglycerol synthase domain-containing protein [Rhizomicrobium sp.]|jgi:putative membrane protein|nr:lysylphosphatidylglycerol synthase domain-containing protein [Rhizomicrobium sp.]
MKLGVAIAAIAGLAIAAYLVVFVGFDAVISAAASLGWGGFALFTAASFLLFVPLGASWFVLSWDGRFSRLGVFVFGRMIRDSAGEILPFSHVGGLVIGARAVILRGETAPHAFGTTVVDMTTEMVAQVAFIAVGITLLLTNVHQTAANENLINGLIVGLGLAFAAALVFYVLQRRGLGVVHKITARFLPAAVAHTEAVHRVIDALYAAPVRVWLSIFLHFLGWIGTACLSFLALRLMGVQIGFGAVVAIEALLCGIRSAAMFIPGALGVQEAGYAMIGPLFGLPPDQALALSLLRRARDIVIGVPVLLIWQGMEGERAFAAGKADAP